MVVHCSSFKLHFSFTLMWTKQPSVCTYSQYFSMKSDYFLWLSNEINLFSSFVLCDLSLSSDEDRDELYKASRRSEAKVKHIGYTMNGCYWNIMYSKPQNRISFVVHILPSLCVCVWERLYPCWKPPSALVCVRMFVCVNECFML